MNPAALAYIDDDAPHVMFRPLARRSPVSTDFGPSPSPRSATTNQQSEPLWLRPSLQKVTELMSLAPGWDGPGSVPPTAEVAVNALTVLSSIAKPTTPPPAIAPIQDGRLQLVWYAAGLELEITVDDKGRTDISLFEVETEMDEEDVTLSDPRLTDAMARLSAAA